MISSNDRVVFEAAWFSLNGRAIYNCFHRALFCCEWHELLRIETFSSPSRSFRCSVLFQVHRLAFDFGKHLGVAFQLVDDALDFEVSAASLGKPAMADMKLGIATAPVLFAQREFPELRKLVERKFSAPGDVEEAHLRVVQSNGLSLTRQLAFAHASSALDALQQLTQSPARDSLFQICHLVCTRQK